MFGCFLPARPELTSLDGEKKMPRPERSEGRSRAVLSLVALLALALAFGLWAGGFLELELLVRQRARLKGLVEARPVWSALVYVVLYLVWVNLFIPDSLLSIAGGLMFGTALGTPLIIVGTTLGSWIQFRLARGALRPYLEARLRGRGARWSRAFEGRGFAAALSLRLIPGAPTSLQNLAPALLGCSTPAFVAATALGLVPIKFFLASFGAALGEALDAEELALGEVLSLERVLALLILAAIAALRWHRQGEQPGEDLEDGDLEVKELDPHEDGDGEGDEGQGPHGSVAQDDKDPDAQDAEDDEQQGGVPSVVV